ncbi:MAG: methyltransferase domain-containing protein [Bacteroidia bacterium]
MGNPFFHFKQFSILKQEKGLKVTTDSCLLGALANYYSPKRCLDIGTGTGVIAMMLAQKFPNSKIDAIDIEDEIVKQAQFNINHSIFSSQIEISNSDVLNFSKVYLYDLITCNPPYFSNHLKKASSEKNSAIHNLQLPLDQFIKSIKSLLNPNGVFWVIYPNYESELFKELAIQSNLFPIEEYQIFTRPEKMFRKITSYSLQAVSNIQDSILVLNNDEGEKTAQFTNLMRPFYLENTELYQSKA